MARTQRSRRGAVAAALSAALALTTPLATLAKITEKPTPYRYAFPYKPSPKVMDYPYDDRLKVTLPTAYTIARLAQSCLYFHDIWANLEYDGQSLLYWCKREIKWGAYWLLKTHVPANGKRTMKWGKKDSFIVMVGQVQDEPGKGPPMDFECFKRAENIPDGPHCTKEDYPEFADLAVRSGHALLDFARSYPNTMVKREPQVQRTYPSTNAVHHIMYAASMMTFIHGLGCSDDTWPLCAYREAVQFRKLADSIWATPQTQGALYRPILDWDATYIDSAILLDIVGGVGVGSEYRLAIESLYLLPYVKGDGTGGIQASPLGMRVQKKQEWANLRLASFASGVAGYYATLKGVSEEDATIAMCMARSQMGYIVGDTGYSYVVGYGRSWPAQVHHRDSACTLREDAKGQCDCDASKEDKKCAFYQDRPNPYVLNGAIVGGPASNDTFEANRSDYEFTEVALDYNLGLMTGLVAVASFPPKFWNTAQCGLLVDNYPWSDARREQSDGSSTRVQAREEPPDSFSKGRGDGTLEPQTGESTRGDTGGSRRGGSSNGGSNARSVAAAPVAEVEEPVGPAGQ